MGVIVGQTFLCHFAWFIPVNQIPTFLVLLDDFGPRIGARPCRRSEQRGVFDELVMGGGRPRFFLLSETRVGGVNARMESGLVSQPTSTAAIPKCELSS